MIIMLLAIIFCISGVVCFIIARIFKAPLESILHRLIPEDIGQAWLKYLQFAIYVVGISSGVNVWSIENYLTPDYNQDVSQPLLVLSSERWALEIYKTIIDTLSGIAWMLLVFFVIALIAYVIIRIFEAKQSRS